jgi:hypothetical protein
MAPQFLRRSAFASLATGVVSLGVFVVNSPKVDASVPCVRVQLSAPVSTVFGDPTCMQQAGATCPFVTFASANVSVRVDVCVPNPGG